MAFGKPDILDPKFELRPIQAAIRAARQRIVILEAAVTVLQNVGSTTQNVAVLQAQVASLLALLSNVQDANTVFAGPRSGSAAQAQFRTLGWADLPLVSELSFTSGVDGDELVAVERDGTMVYTTLPTVNRALVHTVGDITLDYTVRLCVVNAGSLSAVITLPSGNLPTGRTVPISIRRADNGSGPGSFTVSIVAPSGEMINGSMDPFDLADQTGVTLLASGDGWVQA